jgi:CDP-glucose 4,6-dehydratase
VYNLKVIERIFEQHPIDIFFHAAYGADVHRVLDEPLECFKSSALSTWQILDFLRKSRPKCISVISSTDKVYGRQAIPFRENMALLPIHPYEAAKASQDYAAQSYGKIYRCPVAVTRCGNYFGGYDFNFSRLIPGVIQSIMRGELPTLRTNGRFTRDFLYIEDAVEAQLLLAQRLSENPAFYGEAFNFSYGERIEVRDIAKRICRLLDTPTERVVNENSTAEIPHLELSSDKAKHQLGWQPSFGFEHGLERTVRWYREHSSTLLEKSATLVACAAPQHGPGRAQAEAAPTFSSVDTNNDGQISRSEWDAYLSAEGRTVDEGVIVRDPDGVIRYWSKEAQSLYGWTPQEVLGLCTHDLFETQFPKSLAAIEQQMREQMTWQGELIHKRRDGSTIRVNSCWNIQHNPVTQSVTVIEINATNSA